MRVIVCGGTGFIGTALSQALLDRGDEVCIVTRHRPAAPAAGFLYMTWEEWSAKPNRWGSVDAIVCLAGEPISKRWTEDAKHRILISRTQTALHLADIVRRMDEPPRVLVNASAVALYGHSTSPILKQRKRKKSRVKTPGELLSHERNEDAVTADVAGIRGFSHGSAVQAAPASAGRYGGGERTTLASAGRYGDGEGEAYGGEREVRESGDAERTGSPLGGERTTDEGADIAELLRSLRAASAGRGEFGAGRAAAGRDDDRESIGNEAAFGYANGSSAFEAGPFGAFDELTADDANRFGPAYGFASSPDYGWFDEDSPAHPEDYLGRVAVAWEEAVDCVPVDRIVKLRISLVLGRHGGTFPLLRLPYRLFAGGRMGTGTQGFPWIHLDDLISLILFSLDHAELSGPVNAVAPDPVNNDQFGRTLGRVTRRGHWLHVPEWLLRRALGEQSVLLLAGQHVYPRRAIESGFVFAYPRLEDALRDLTH